ncbi:MAG TPA: YdeI/OmpD-associated family protein [Actinomycetales bacterium]|nr:YdeI/OmpD-associated family protein [Actinomycetales bacterium]
MPMDDPQLCVPDAAAWRAWLLEHHENPDGVWLALARKGKPGPTTLTYEQAVEEALCFGWIDGQARGGDGVTRVVRFTRRRARSMWSQRNVERVGRLVADGRMHRAGLAEVERAKADGRWEAAYDGPASIQMPEDLAAALAAEPKAKAVFEKLNSTNRYAVLYRVTTAKRPETRQRRIEKLVADLARGETPYPQRQA